MAINNRDRVGRAMDIFATGLAPFVERQMDSRVGASWRRWVDGELVRKFERNADGSIHWDSQALLKVMIDNWREVFSKTLGHAERALVGELIEVRNRWAHQRPFSYDDTHRALDSAQRLLERDLRRRAGRRNREDAPRGAPHHVRGAGAPADPAPVDPGRGHAADRPEALARGGDAPSRRRERPLRRGRVRGRPRPGATGRCVEEYGDPVEFFRRTYLTDGLTRLLESALRRLSGQPGGDPVIELQTNFGGGKTHSMLALYHVCGHEDPKTCRASTRSWRARAREPAPGSAGRPGRHGAVAGRGWTGTAPRCARSGASSPGSSGGADGYRLVEASDRNGVSPGSDLLHALLAAAAPCLILIDEWIAFVRQLYSASGLPAGSFDANITFAQALTEAVKATPGALLVASLPASQIEIGGEGGDVALERLKNTFGRIESSWRPASADEGFEIVRRRLFQPMIERESFAARDNVIKAFVAMYSDNGASFRPSAARATTGGGWRRPIRSTPSCSTG